MTTIPNTNENLKRYATKPLTRWLIDAAKRESSITYGEAGRRLETEIGFSKFGRFTRVGTIVAFELMSEIQKKWQKIRNKYPEKEYPDKCPLLNILLVLQETQLASDGAGGFVADYLDDPSLKSCDPKSPEWRKACKKVARNVYAFKDWDQVYRDTFGKGKEKDGIDGFRYDRRGEGENHKNLRIWVTENPGKIKKTYKDFGTETEVPLDSADRVDVVYCGQDKVVAIEVKSRDSNDEDLRRGVFQCIKYRAVMKAMDTWSVKKVVALLVTQKGLPDNLRLLCRRNRIRHFKAPRRITIKQG